MKNLSLFHLILLSVFGALAVAGILVFALATGSSTTSTVGPISIWGTLNEKAFSTVIQRYTDSEPRLSQVTYVQKDPATYESDLTTALANGGGPDLFLLRQDYALLDGGKIAPIPLATLSGTQFQSTFLDAANTFFFPQVGALGIPLFVDPLVLYWNRDALASAGFAKPPAYWEELAAMAQAITKRNDSGNILKATIALGQYANVSNAKDILSVLILQNGAAITAINSQGHLSSALDSKDSAMRPAENALRFYTQFANPSDEANYTWNGSLPDSRNAFAAGDVAFYLGFASEAPLMGQLNPNLNFAIAPLPQFRSRNRTVNTAHVYALAISRIGANQNNALTVASILAGPALAQNLSVAVGMPSALRDVVSLPAEGYDNLFNKEAIISRSWIDPNPEKTSAIFRAMIERVTSGAFQVTDAVQRAGQEMQQIIGI